MNNFEIAKNILHIITVTTAECMVYNNWSADYVAKSIRNLSNDIKKNTWYKDINPSDLTEEEMKELGFRKWDIHSKGYLIPLWIFPFLQEEIKCVSITDREVIKKSELDTDHRFGMLAYTVAPKL